MSTALRLRRAVVLLFEIEFFELKDIVVLVLDEAARGLLTRGRAWRPIQRGPDEQRVCVTSRAGIL